jgi:fumarate hydratase class II
LHFQDAGEEKIAKSIEALKEVEWVFAGHCTGIKEVNVNDYLPGDRILEAKENPEFFRLRNRIMALTREQAKRTEEIMVADE